MNPLGMNGIQPGHPGIAAMQMKGPNGAVGRVGGPDNNLDDRLQKQKKHLNTAIYDYFIKCEQWDLCRAIKTSGIPIEFDDGKSGLKQEDGDSREDANRPPDVPAAHGKWKGQGFDTAHLLDWYSVFWEIMMTASNPNKNDGGLAAEYSKHASTQNRLQHQHQMNILRGLPPGMTPQQMALMRARPMMGMTPQQQQQMLQKQLMNRNMAREGSGMDGDGQRPRTPLSADNAPSPSKRQRLDPPFAGPVMPNGVGPQMDMQSMGRGIVPHQLTPQQLHTLQNATPQVRQKAFELFYKHNQGAHDQQQRANMVGPGGSPIVQPGMDPQMMQGSSEFYASNNPRMGAAAGNNNGHALQDYQMQLMLLERQNRKRLEMAKQEHQDGTAAPNGNMIPYAPNMSPSGSRQGPSPNPSDQMKQQQQPGGQQRGTPKLNPAGVPDSPMPPDASMQQRASPSAMNYNPMQPGMENAMQMGASTMRPPSHPGGFPNGGPMNPAMMRNQQGGGPNPGQMNGANFQQAGQQGPMGPGGQQMPGQMGTQRNQAMPPPQGVPPGNQNATGRASPAPSAASSTPQQTHKANPKKNQNKAKERKASKATSKAAAAAAAAAANPAEGSEAAATTSTPATPITPAIQNPSNKQAGGAAGNQGGNAAGSSGPGQPNGAPTAGHGPQLDANAVNASDPNLSMNFNDDEMSLAFPSDLQAGDVLENFNFDNFIEDPPQNFNMDSYDFGPLEGGMENDAIV